MYKMRWVIIISLFMCSNLIGQGLVFSSEVSKDHILAGEVFEISFTIENGKGDFIPPPLEHFIIVGGPNVQSSMQVINGEVSQEKKYTYYLKAREEGEWILESARLLSSEGEFSSPEILITVDGGQASRDHSVIKPKQSRKKTKEEILRNFKKRKI